MELLLNLAWGVLAVVMAALWMRFGTRQGSRRAQFVALALLVLIIFPVISVSDDLQALQNPAEVDSCMRRDHVVVSAHSILPAVVALVSPVLSEPAMGLPRHAFAGDPPKRIAALPSLAAVANRPPPAA